MTIATSGPIPASKEAVDALLREVVRIICGTQPGQPDPTPRAGQVQLAHQIHARFQETPSMVIDGRCEDWASHHLIGQAPTATGKAVGQRVSERLQPNH